VTEGGGWWLEAVLHPPTSILQPFMWLNPQNPHLTAPSGKDSLLTPLEHPLHLPLRHMLCLHGMVPSE